MENKIHMQSKVDPKPLSNIVKYYDDKKIYIRTNSGLINQIVNDFSEILVMTREVEPVTDEMEIFDILRQARILSPTKPRKTNIDVSDMKQVDLPAVDETMLAKLHDLDKKERKPKDG